MTYRNILDQQEVDNQVKYLNYCLTQLETGKNKFFVLNNEAGFSKSRITDVTVALNYGRKYLLVKKFNDEQWQSLENMRERISSEDWDFGTIPNDRIVLIHAGNSNLYENELGYKLELITADIVIISHEKYRLLSNSNKLHLYTKNRHTLIIDEFLELPIIRISERYLKDCSVLFPSKDLGRDDYVEIQDFFLNLLKSDIELVKRSNMALLELSKTNKQGANIVLEKLTQLKALFNGNMAQFLEGREDILYKGQPITYLTYVRFFNDIESIIKNQSIFCSFDKCLSTFQNFRFWTLKNNIILDASGDILSEYKLNSELFELKPQKKVFNYDNTTIHIKAFNSFKSNIESKFAKDNSSESTRLYLTSISKYIESTQKPEDKTLIVNYKRHFEDYTDLWNIPGTNCAWHGNILGKNDWREFNKLFINSIYNVPDANYILSYSFFKSRRITKNDLKMKLIGGSRQYQNTAIEELKQNFILHNLYQTIKRINRDVNQKSSIYIVTNNKHFLNNIQELMVNIHMFSNYRLSLPKIYRTPAQLEKDKELQLVEAELNRLLSIDKSNRREFLKAEFCQKLGWKTNTLKEKFTSVKKIKNLCEKYRVDLKKTFRTTSVKHIHFKAL